MSEPHKTDPTPLGIYDRPQKFQITAVEIVAVTLSILWLLGAAVFFMTMDASESDLTAAVDPMRFVIIMLAIFMPVAMIWVAATATRASRVMREESQRLQTAIDAIRHAYIAQAQGRASLSEPSVTKKLDEIAAAQRKTETALATFTSSREPVPAAAPLQISPPLPDDEPVLPLGTTSEDIAPPLPTDTFITAMNFPENVEDAAGFTALRKALKDRTASQLIQAAQDVLTLMSQDGIYMDDLRPDMARPEIWRKFADGARGREVAALGGVRDRSSLALSAGRMRQDPIFRDAVHHFLRKFDQMFTQFAPNATDSEISALSDTRTARAFMLLGRVTGTFD